MIPIRRLIPFFLAFTTILLSSCGNRIAESSPMPIPTAVAAPFPKDGHWESVDEQSHAVSFDVSEGRITYFKIVISGDCAVEINGSINIDTDNSFKIGEVDAAGEPIKAGITGTFNSLSTVIGLIANPYACGNYDYGSSNPDFPIWTAEWISP